MNDAYAIRGFSVRYGEELAAHRHEELTRLMLSAITQRPMMED